MKISFGKPFHVVDNNNEVIKYYSPVRRSVLEKAVLGVMMGPRVVLKTWGTAFPNTD